VLFLELLKFLFDPGLLFLLLPGFLELPPKFCRLNYYRVVCRRGAFALR
jgi:hypothetical protein